MRVQDFSDAQQCLLEAVYLGFREVSSWPTSAYIDAILDHDHGLDYEKILVDLPLSVVVRSPGYSQQSVVKLTVAGLHSVEAARADLENFVAIVGAAAEREAELRPHPSGVAELELNTEDADGIWGRQLATDELRRVMEIMHVEGVNAGSRGVDDDGEWSLGFDRRIRPYRGVQDVDDYLARRPEPVSQTWAPPLPAAPYIFVLMPFEAAWSKNVKDTIDLACGEAAHGFAGLSWERADEITETGRITDQIVTAIERADALIADITGTNPNVLFELGYADALGRSVVVLNQTVDDTPFDIKDWRQIGYAVDDLAKLRQDLVDFLVATLRRQGFPVALIDAEAEPRL